MAAALHIFFDQRSQHGSMLRNLLNQLEFGRDTLFDMVATMQLMLEGDGTQDAHYSYMTTKFGFPDVATAHTAYNELVALQAKLNTNASVTNVLAAMDQAFNKFR